MSRLSVPLLLAVTFMCAGCIYKWDAPPPRPESMAPVLHHPVHQSPSTVVVSVPIREDIIYPPLRKDFATALQRSIERSGLFAHVLKDGTANYELRAVFTQFDVPWFGFDMTVSMQVDYTLIRNESKQVVWHKTITSSYTESTENYHFGNYRIDAAIDGAARNNIEQAIQEMSQLGLE